MRKLSRLTQAAIESSDWIRELLCNRLKTKKNEDRIAANVPVTENSTIYAVAKDTVKKSAIVFAVALMISVFASFLLEDLKKKPGSTFLETESLAK